MGEVYKARDARLGRTVAIKVLPPHVSADPEARQRFEREAQAIASLSHPHICVLHDIGRDRPKNANGEVEEPVDFLVMEYLEGVTLAERLAAGPMPLGEALEVARQIADALDQAHRSGIVHRDLKPANIFLVSGSGITAKLLDFGLARSGGAVRTAGSMTTQALNVSALSTAVAAPITAQGTILGTFQYMAPEQIEGREVDARADVFAFGAVLYEMLTGRPAFHGSSAASIMAATLATDPPAPSTLVPVSPRIDHVLRRCLEKNPANRWQSIRDMALELQSAADPRDPLSVALAMPARATVAPATSWKRPWFAAAAAAVATVVIAMLAALYLREPAGEAPGVRFELQVPGSSFFVSVSPDGRTLVYNAPGPDGRAALWVRPLDALEARILPGTSGSPDWSPDGRSLVFAQDNALKRLDLAGGPAETITPLPGGGFQRATWSRDGVIVFSNGTRLYRVAASGGEPVLLSEPDASRGESSHATPSFLPDGRRYLYTAWSPTPEARGLYVSSIDDTDPMAGRVRLMPAESKAVYVEPGYLLYLRNRTLMARPFDADRLQFTGEARRIADDVLFNPASGAAAFAASSGGTIVFRPGGPALAADASREWRWADRKGQLSDPVGSPHGDTHVVLSHDGTRIAFAVGPPDGADIWVHDLTRGVRTRLTTHVASDVFPVWSPDDGQLVFASTTAAGPAFGRNATVGQFVPSSRENGLYLKPANGAISERLLVGHEPRVTLLPGSWSSDGTIVAVRVLDNPDARGTPTTDLWLVPRDGATPMPYLSTPFLKVQPALSPDGRWLAYTTNESGTWEVFVQPFPDPSAGKVQVSSSGGIAPRWKRDGRELYYINANSQLVAVPVIAGNSFGLGAPTALFDTPLPFPGPGLASVPYEVAPDGQRFLLSLPRETTARDTPLVVITSWAGALRQ
jgi:Tol biopolymer transport system component/tRNA A-37 threonylcarbamoyl transferase component Bud32